MALTVSSKQLSHVGGGGNVPGTRNRGHPNNVPPRMDSDEREAIRAEGHYPDDAAVVAALDLVRWELELLGSGQLDIPI